MKAGFFQLGTTENKNIVHAIISSGIDYCNSLYFGISPASIPEPPDKSSYFKRCNGSINHDWKEGLGGYITPTLSKWANCSILYQTPELCCCCCCLPLWPPLPSSEAQSSEEGPLEVLRSSPPSWKPLDTAGLAPPALHNNLAWCVFLYQKRPKKVFFYSLAYGAQRIVLVCASLPGLYFLLWFT